MRQIDPDWGVMELIKAEIIKDSYVAKKNMKLCEEVLDFLSENEGDYAAIERKFEEADRKKDYDRRNLLRIAVHKLRTSKEIPYAVGEKVRFIGGECEVMRIYTNREEEMKEWHRNAAGFEADEYHFRLAWLTFLNLGLYGFNFTLDEIGEAYFKKNKTNHERQDEGY